MFDFIATGYYTQYTTCTLHRNYRIFEFVDAVSFLCEIESDLLM